MKWVGFFALLILDVAGGWLIWADTQTDWGRKSGMEESFLTLPLGSEKKLDEESVATLLNVEWKSSLPDIF
ncbi:MAG: hypothetical protein Q4D62_09385 [Planctomycetia bacterium]|nr:hypothetical protein [Planctomycetia bacterium]